MNTWDTWADYYRQQDDEADFTDATSLVSKFTSQSGVVADMGCGAGGLARALSKMVDTTIGVDKSRAMITTAMEHPADDGRVVWIREDMTQVRLPQAADVVTCMHSTVCSLTSPEAQQAFLRNVSDNLSQGGVFICETYVPSQSFLFPAKSLEVMDVNEAGMTLLGSKVNIVTQRAWMQELTISTDSGMTQRFFEQRYVWPSELDALALRAGLTKIEQMSDYSGSPVVNTSRKYLAVYRMEGLGEK